MASVVQSKAATSATSVTFDSSTTSGNKIVVTAWSYNTSLATNAISDNKGNTYTQRAVINSGVTTKAAIYESQDSPTMGASHQVSIAAGTDQGLCAYEVNGLTTTPFDKQNTGGPLTTAAPATGSTGTLTQADELVFALVCTDQGNSDTITPTAGESWTQDAENENGASVFCFNTVHKTVAATTALSASWALQSSHAWACAIATFKIDTSAGASGTAAWTEADDTCAASGWNYGRIWGEYVKEVGFVTNTTAGTTSAITVATGGVPIGDVIVIIGACDNTGTNGAATTISVADNSSQAGTANTYTLQTPQALADPGAASAGQQGFLVVCPVTRALLAADTVTITYGNSTTAKAINAQQFTKVRLGTPVLSGTYAHQDNQTGTTVSVAATPTFSGQVMIAGTMVEGGTADTFTPDSDTTSGTWVTLTRRGSGTTTSGSTLNSQYKLIRATNAVTYDPTLGTSRDHCAAVLILDAVVQGIAAWTEADDSAAGTGQRGHVGTAAWTEADDTLAASGSVGGGASITGTAAWTEANDGWTAAGKVGHTGTAAWTEANDGCTAAGIKTHKATAAWTEANDSLAAAGTRTHKATAAWTEDSDTFVATSHITLYPATISGRKVRDQNGNVYLNKTMSSWGMAQNLSNANITIALEGVAANGFNSVLIAVAGCMVESGTPTWVRYQNAAGQSFFTGTPWASSLGAAWVTHDWIISEANRLGLFVWMSMFGGTGGSSEGARLDWVATTNTQMYNRGVEIATRYLAVDNIGWHLEWDNVDNPGDPSGQRAEAFFQGVNDTEGASRRPVRWMEPNNGGTSNDTGWNTAPQFAGSILTWYNNSTTSSTELVEGTYALSWTGPIGDCEPAYNSSGRYATNFNQNLRERTWATFLEGGCLINYGDEDWWPFGKAQIFTGGLTWDQVQAAAPTQWQKYAWRVLDQYVADVNWVPEAGTFVTTGTGSGDTKCAAGKQPNAAIAYFPNSRTIAVDTTIIAGTSPVRLRWYDPTAGTYTLISGSEAQQTGRSVTHPGNTSNSTGTGDWVLIVDLPLSATAAWVETDDTFTAAGTPKRLGIINYTEANDILTAAGKLNRTGTVAYTEANDGLAAAGKVGHRATLAWTEAQDSLSGSGVGHQQTGTVAWTEVADTLAVTGTRTHVGSSAWTEAADTLAAIGGAGTAKGGPAAWTEADDGFSASGFVGHRATLAWTEADDTCSAIGNAAHPAAAAWTEADDSAAGTGQRGHVGTAAWTEANDVFAGFEGEAPPWGARPLSGSIQKIAVTGGIQKITSQGANL